ncbi:hypothetical protein AAZX31_14G132000 [Glycine max]
MPVNRGQGQTTRWYQLCFIPTSSDNSDDSDIESVVLTPSNLTQTSSTWQELSPPIPPESEPEIDWSLPPPPPPPPPPSPPPPLPNFLPLQRVVLTLGTPTPTSSTWQELFPPSSPLSSPPRPTRISSTWQELSPPSSPLSSRPPTNLEPEIDMSLSLLSPPPLLPDFLQSRPLQRASARTFNIEVQQDRHQPPSPSHVFEGDQSDCSMNVKNGITRVRVSEIDKLFHCPICMDEFKVGGDKACQLPCTHTYCSECILRWLDNNKTCPVCRLQLNGCSFDSINCNNGLDSQPQIPSLPSRSPIVHNDSPQRWENFSQSPPYLLQGIENSINDNNGLDSQPEILLPPPPPPPSAHNDLHRPWEYYFESPYLIVQDIENSEGGNSDEADYDSACDELGDPHEDGASQSVPAPLT